MGWDWCVGVTLVSGARKHEEKKWKSCWEFERRCDLFLRFISGALQSSVHAKTFCLCSSGHFVLAPSSAIALSWSTDWDALTPITLNAHQGLGFALGKACCLIYQQSFGSFVETFRAGLINERCNAKICLQLEMKWQDDGEKAHGEDHHALHGELMTLNRVMHKIWPTAQEEVWIIQVCRQNKIGTMW